MTRGRAPNLAVVALALASAGITFPHAWSWVSGERDSFVGLNSPTLVFKYQELLPEEEVVFAQQRLRPKERYYVAARPGSLFAGVSYPTAVRTFARYALLPAVQVQDPQAVDAIVGVGVDPATLGLHYKKVDWDPNGGIVVAQVAR